MFTVGHEFLLRKDVWAHYTTMPRRVGPSLWSDVSDLNRLLRYSGTNKVSLVNCGRAIHRLEWGGSTGMIPQSHKKRVWNSARSVFYRVSEDAHPQLAIAWCHVACNFQFDPAVFLILTRFNKTQLTKFTIVYITIFMFGVIFWLSQHFI